MKKILFILVAMLSFISAQETIKVINIGKYSTDLKIECIDQDNKGIDKVSADLNGTIVKLNSSSDLPTAVYVLIDSSIPMRQAYKKGIEPFLKANIPKVQKKNIHIIISTFDKDLVHIYNSKNNSKLVKALKKIKISGQMTELWRNTIEALKELQKTNQRRKILVLMSDGDAEDTPAYPISDAINYAKAHNIRIASLAYRDTIGVQNLRKIAEETSGKLWVADKKTQKVSEKLYKEFSQFVDSQFIVSVPKDILSPSLNGKQNVKFLFQKNKQEKNITITLPTKKIITTRSFWKKNKLYLLAGAATILLLLLLLLLKPKKEEETEDIPEKDPIPFIPKPKPIAFLESMGGTRHKIFKFPSTIGKKGSNDVVIDGHYISRNHAVIDLKDGIFYITDIDSANGTSVNGKEVKGTVQIKPKDKIEFGPYKTTFILN